ncbi:hypothetical protein C4J81_13500 [Deltaproteobacteria bacterium Smac51]|nr:hypothetical protein C4J81_13500 [Deltaproteobacteria bacterium Smac51]
MLHSAAEKQTMPEPAVVSFSRAVNLAPGQEMTAGEAADRVEVVLHSLAGLVRQGGGFIGHIKTFISFDHDGGLGMSVVRDQVERQSHYFKPAEKTESFNIAVTAIVYGYKKDELARLVSFGLDIGLPRNICRPEAVSDKFKPIAPFTVTKTRPVSGHVES